MKKNILYILLSIFALSIYKGYTQRSDDTIANSIYIVTDRQLYVTEDMIYIAAIAPGYKAESLFFTELVTWDGKQIVGKKYKTTGSVTYGNFLIPSDIFTGYYFIRTYLLNKTTNESEFAYCKVEIVNPNSILKVFNTDLSQKPDLKVVPKNDELKIVTDKLVFKQRDKIQITIRNENIDSPARWLSVSIIPINTIDTLVTDNEINLLYDLNNRFNISSSPQLTLKGRVSDEEKLEGVPYAMVNVTLLNQKPDLIISTTDNSGEYSILLPCLYGLQELYIGIDAPMVSKPKLLVENDFYNGPTPFVQKDLSINFEKTEIVRQLYFNLMVNKEFTNTCNTKHEKPNEEKLPFYGKPDKIIRFEDFVSLRSMEEYFFELINEVKVIKIQNKRHLKIFSNYPEMSIYKPLLMVDYIPVADAEALLKMNPVKVSRIEIIAQPYLKGEFIAGGIISVITKQGNFGGIELPSSDIFLVYRFPDEPFNSLPQYCDLPQNQPDCRNTLFFESFIPGKYRNEISIKAKAPDSKGKYLIYLQGLKNDGEPFTCWKVISVN